MPGLDLDAFMAQLRELQQKETIAEILAEPLARSLLAVAVGLLFVALLLVGPKPSEKTSDLDKALQGAPRRSAAMLLPQLTAPAIAAARPLASSAPGPSQQELASPSLHTTVAAWGWISGLGWAYLF